jgi:hypothetical protein
LTAALLTFATVAPVSADDSGSVPGTVTVAGGACIQVSGSLNYGTLPFNPAGQRVPNPSQVGAAAPAIINCDPFAAADLLARGSDAGSTTDASVVWDLSVSISECPTDGLSNFGHAIYNPADNTGLLLSNTDAPGLSPLPINGGMSIAGDLFMPCQNSAGAGHTMTFSVVFTALQL